MTEEIIIAKNFILKQKACNMVKGYCSAKNVGKCFSFVKELITLESDTDGN